jgi:4'-phosphopantetheinyl transferase
MTGQWLESPTHPVLASNEAHVWLAHLPSARTGLEQLRGTLSGDETSRAEKFRFTEHRERWQMTRGILRRLLAHYLEVPASEITFNYNAQGKPELKHPGSSSFHFNASHSGDYAVFAFTLVGEVGVDIERIRHEMPRLDEIASRYFAPGEQQQLFALPESERAEAFFTLWTRKEAFVKARGTGLFSGLDQFEVALDAPRVVTVPKESSPADWWMAALPGVPGYAGALVVHSRECSARFWKWGGDATAR